MDIRYPGSGIIGYHGVADRMHEMGLAQAHAAIEEEWVVGLGRSFRDGDRRRMGELI